MNKNRRNEGCDSTEKDPPQSAETRTDETRGARAPRGDRQNTTSRPSKLYEPTVKRCRAIALSNLTETPTNRVTPP